VPWSNGCPPADDDALAEEPDGAIGAIGATVPELAVASVPGEFATGAGLTGGVSVGPLKFIGCCPASICGVTT
jgi:hypothetical protein